MPEQKSRPKNLETEHDRVVKEAEAALKQAQTRKTEVETREALAKAEQAENQLINVRIMREREVEKRARELTDNDRHYTYVFDKAVSDESVKACIKQLTTWHRQDPTAEWTLHLNSPGGSIFDGFALIDFINHMRRKGHRVRMVGYGMVASMAGVLLQAADERIMAANAFLLIHEGSLGASGDYAHVKDRVKLMEMFQDRILDLFVTRALPINPKTTKNFIKRRWERVDWWMPSEEAAKLGLIDYIEGAKPSETAE